jgi:hypothetical protein
MRSPSKRKSKEPDSRHLKTRSNGSSVVVVSFDLLEVAEIFFGYCEELGALSE